MGDETIRATRPERYAGQHRFGGIHASAESGGKLWFALSMGFQLVFWVCAIIWLSLAGEAGSPRPDNWKVLDFWLRVVEIAAPCSLVASILCSCVAWVRESRVPFFGFVSLGLLLLMARFKWHLF